MPRCCKDGHECYHFTVKLDSPATNPRAYGEAMNAQDILGKLISFPTVSDQDATPLINWAAAYLKGLGAVVEIIEGKQKGKANLWARLGPDVEGGLVLAGHIDVVPVEGQPWTKPPFSMTVQDGRLYGRGACDMKGFVACCLAAAARVDPSKLVKPLYIALTCDEEVNMTGAVALVSWVKDRKIKADWVWLGEPTELEVVTAHKGTGTVRTTITGLSAHSSLPHKGVSANEMAVKVCNWIMRKSEEFASIPVVGSPFDPPYSSINIGVISGGKAANIIADHCEILWQYRLHPDDDIQAAFKEYELMLENEVRPELAQFPQTSIRTEYLTNIPPFLAPEGGEGEVFLCARTGKGTPIAVSYATEAGLYQEIASSVVICGPGSITKAHQPDEYVPLSDIVACLALLDKAIENDIPTANNTK